MDEPIHLPALLSYITGVPRSEVRRAITQGEITINGTPWTEMDLPPDVLGENDFIQHPFSAQRQRRDL